MPIVGMLRILLVFAHRQSQNCTDSPRRTCLDVWAFNEVLVHVESWILGAGNDCGVYSVSLILESNRTIHACQRMYLLIKNKN